MGNPRYLKDLQTRDGITRRQAPTDVDVNAAPMFAWVCDPKPLTQTGIKLLQL